MRKKKLQAGEENVFWKQFKTGDKTAFDYLMQAFYQDLFRYATKFTKDKELIKDCLQELFLELWKNRAGVSETNFVKAYLLKSIRNKIRREIRKTHRQAHAASLEEYCFDVEFSFEQLLIREQTLKDTAKKITTLLNNLPQRQKEIIYLRFFQELEVEEIVQIMEIHPQSVYNLLHKALDRLRQTWVSETEYLSITLFLCSLCVK